MQECTRITLLVTAIMQHELAPYQTGCISCSQKRLFSSCFLLAVSALQAANTPATPPVKKREMRSFCDGEDELYSCLETAIMAEKLVLAVSGYRELYVIIDCNYHELNKKQHCSPHCSFLFPPKSLKKEVQCASRFVTCKTHSV